MSDRRPLRVLFRVVAGPRAGYGHLVRATVLADALGVQARISIRGPSAAASVARRLGGAVITGTAQEALARERPDVLVLDDCARRGTTSWRRAARRIGLPVVSVHDAGIGRGPADLFVDGSIVAGGPPRGAGAALCGPRYAVIRKPRRRTRRPGRHDSGGPVVLIALGGGPRFALAVRLARALLAAVPGVRVRVAGGFGAVPMTRVDRVTFVRTASGLGAELARADAALVAGGVTLYEACAAGTPVVAAAVVPAQRPAIEALARLGAVIDGGGGSARWWTGPRIARAVALVAETVDDRRRAEDLSDSAKSNRGRRGRRARGCRDRPTRRHVGRPGSREAERTCATMTRVFGGTAADRR